MGYDVGCELNAKVPMRKKHQVWLMHTHCFLLLLMIECVFFYVLKTNSRKRGGGGTVQTANKQIYESITDVDETLKPQEPFKLLRKPLQ